MKRLLEKSLNNLTFINLVKISQKFGFLYKMCSAKDKQIEADVLQIKQLSNSLEELTQRDAILTQQKQQLDAEVQQLKKQIEVNEK